MSIIDGFRADLEGSGIKKGDVVVVGSNVRQLLLRMMYEEKAEFGAARQPEKYLDDIIDMFKDLVGASGTVMFHAFFWAFCHGGAFDFDSAKCETGILSERALARKDFIRTQHPIYSFAVCGADAPYLAGMNNKMAFGDDSPFRYMHEKNAVCVNIDVPAFTFVHYVEQTIGVEYRFEKEFTGTYIKNGESSERTYSMLVRYLCLDVKTLPFWEDFLDGSCLTNIFTSKVRSQIIRCAPAYDQLASDIKNSASEHIVSYDREKAAMHLQYED